MLYYLCRGSTYDVTPLRSKQFAALDFACTIHTCQFEQMNREGFFLVYLVLLLIRGICASTEEEEVGTILSYRIKLTIRTLLVLLLVLHVLIIHPCRSHSR